MQCKNSNCRLSATKNSHYCQSHLDLYNYKQKLFARRAIEGPTCYRCGVAYFNKSSDYCNDCETTIQEKQAKELRLQKFYDARSLQELKDWIEEYVL